MIDESSLTTNTVQQSVHATSHLYTCTAKTISLVPHAYCTLYASRHTSAYRDSCSWVEGVILHPVQEELAEAEVQARPAVLPVK